MLGLALAGAILALAFTNSPSAQKKWTVVIAVIIAAILWRNK